MIRGLIEKEQNNSIISKITFFAPSNKLKIAGKTEDINEEIADATKTGNKYKKTNELGITNCLEFIKYNQEYVDHLNSFKKKDDLCDAFLHGVHYIERNLEGGVKISKKTKKIVNNLTNPENTLDVQVKLKKTSKKTSKKIVNNLTNPENTLDVQVKLKKTKKTSKKIVNNSL
jgi:hypothetical protein